MGFYDDQPKPKKPRWNGGAWRLLGVIVLSALVGSGATLASEQLAGRTGAITATTSNVPSSAVDQTAVTSNVNVNVSDGITQVVKKVEPDVVAVVNYTTASNFFSQSQSQLQASDIGSGLYFAKSGNNAYIVTNNHVVAGGAKVEIVLQSGKHVAASVVGTDEYTDLAVLKVPVSDFPGVQPAQFANSNNIQVGEPAIAIGNPMGLDFADSVTSGIISGKQRIMPVQTPNGSAVLDYQPVLQTDAAINPGNSGGPLLNIDGQVMGINSSKIVANGFEGMGFAIPAQEVETITSEIIRTGHAVHPAIGIAVQSLSSLPQSMWPSVPVNYGVYVGQVSSSQAKAAGLQVGDVIVGFNGKPVKNTADLRTDLFGVQPGQDVKLSVYRGTKQLTLTVKVGSEKSVLDAGSGSSSTANASGGVPFGYGFGSGAGGFGNSSPFGSGTPF